MAAVKKDKLLRVQGPRSRTGCWTCKLKHVKCDEAVPICGRCLRTKAACHYADRSPGGIDTKFVVYGIPKSPESFPKAPPHEQRALSHFRHRTLDQIEGPFRSEFWSTIVPRLVQDDMIVRQAVMALSAFHEHYLDQTANNHSTTELAQRYYHQARREIVRLKTPDDAFDSILCASIIFCTCEGLRGNFKEAMRHTIAGMKMIAAWRSSTPRRASILTSAAHVLHDVFLALQIQVTEANVNGVQIDLPPELEQHFGHVPHHYSTTEEALPLLQLLSHRLFMLYQQAETYHEDHVWLPSHIAPSLQLEYEAIRTRYAAWSNAVLSLEHSAPNRDPRQHAGFLLLKVFALALEIDLHVFVHGESAYDDLREKNYHIMALAADFIKLLSGMNGPRPCNTDPYPPPSSSTKSLCFTSSPEIVPTLFEIATRTSDQTLRRRAIQLLRSSGRREGIWDGRMAANLAEQIVRLKTLGAATAKNQYAGRKFLITDILLLSEQKCMVRFGFKAVQPGSFNSFWLETIKPGQGLLRSLILTIN